MMSFYALSSREVRQALAESLGSLEPDRLTAKAVAKAYCPVCELAGLPRPVVRIIKKDERTVGSSLFGVIEITRGLDFNDYLDIAAHEFKHHEAEAVMTSHRMRGGRRLHVESSLVRNYYRKVATCTRHLSEVPMSPERICRLPLLAGAMDTGKALTNRVERAVEVIDSLIKEGEIGNDLSATWKLRLKSFDSYLVAVKRGYLPTVERLVKTGADVKEFLLRWRQRLEARVWRRYLGQLDEQESRYYAHTVLETYHGRSEEGEEQPAPLLGELVEELIKCATGARLEVEKLPKDEEARALLQKFDESWSGLSESWPIDWNVERSVLAFFRQLRRSTALAMRLKGKVSPSSLESDELDFDHLSSQFEQFVSDWIDTYLEWMCNNGKRAGRMGFGGAGSIGGMKGFCNGLRFFCE